MASRAGRDRDQTVGAFLDGLMRKAVVDDVVKHDAAIGMRRGIHVLARAKGCYDDRRLVFARHLDVVLEAVVGLVHYLVDRERRGWRIKKHTNKRGEFF